MWKLPVPVQEESRTAFGIKYFATEADADLYGRWIQLRGDRFNGGFFDGMRCGRDVTFDKTVNGSRIYAVTTA